MKKVLFATTALVATAGVAAADITLSGSAEMGIRGGDQFGLSEDGTAIIAGNNDPRFHSAYTLGFTMTSETDNGLSFGATIRYDMDGNPDQENQNPAMDNGTIFISGDFGRVTLGDTDGALDWALTEVAIGGSINDDHTSHAGYNGNGALDGSHDDQVLRYEYSVGDFGFAVSLEQANNGQDTRRDDNLAIGARYGMAIGGGQLSLGIGYQSGDVYVDTNEGAGFSATALRTAYTDSARVDAEYAGADVWGFSAGYEIANFDVRVSYMDWSIDNVSRSGAANTTTSVEHVGFGVGYTFDALTLAFNYGVFDTNLPNTQSEGYGIAANYDLGGGAEIQFGYGDSSVDGQVDSSIYSFGVAMSF